MSNVAKYNVFKGVSTILTLGTPIATVVSCSDFFIHRSDTAISITGIFTMLILALIFKDKIAERWKTPSVFIVSTSILILLILVENIILPIKYVCIATMISTGVDELTFKMLYKKFELILPEVSQSFKHFGFIMAKQSTIDDIANGGTK